MPVIDEWTVDGQQRVRLREDAFHYTFEVQAPKAPLGWRRSIGGALQIVGRRLKHVLIREDKLREAAGRLCDKLDSGEDARPAYLALRALLKEE